MRQFWFRVTVWNSQRSSVGVLLRALHSIPQSYKESENGEWIAHKLHKATTRAGAVKHFFKHLGYVRARSTEIEGTGTRAQANDLESARLLEADKLERAEERALDEREITIEELEEYSSVPCSALEELHTNIARALSSANQKTCTKNLALFPRIYMETIASGQTSGSAMTRPEYCDRVVHDTEHTKHRAAVTARNALLTKVIKLQELLAARIDTDEQTDKIVEMWDTLKSLMPFCPLRFRQCYCYCPQFQLLSTKEERRAFEKLVAVVAVGIGQMLKTAVGVVETMRHLR